MSHQVSYWEAQTFFKTYDFAIIGGGIVGLMTSILLKQHHPNASIVVVERSPIPYGATTRNAGFACFGSLSELLSDQKTMGQEGMLKLVEQRLMGLETLVSLLGKEAIGYEPLGGYEVFTPQQNGLYNDCLKHIDDMNLLLKSIIGAEQTFQESSSKINTFGFQNTIGILENKLEGGVHSGFLIQALIRKAYQLGITLLNGVEILKLEQLSNKVRLKGSVYTLEAEQVIITTNAFASQLVELPDLQPGRGQVLITKPLADLKFQGTFHMEEGYYYFRTIHNRVLLGGGRHLDFETECSTDFTLNNSLQENLKQLLTTTILPSTPYEVDLQWTGIMAFGSTKFPIVKRIDEQRIVGVRCNGMGVALAGTMARQLVDLTL